MRRSLLMVLAFATLAVVGTGGALLWRSRPWRTLVSVNGRVLTMKEASQRADNLPNVAPPRGDEDPAARLRRVAGAWTVKEVLLQEAAARAIKVEPEEMAVAQAAATNGLCGFDFDESVLVSALVRREAFETAFAEGVPAPKGEKDGEAWFRARVQARLGDFVARLFKKTIVRSGAYPEFERAEAAFACSSDDCRFLWLLWKLRPVAAVGEKKLSAHELDLRARTLLNEARHTEHLAIPPAREVEALRHYVRKAAQMWIAKEVLLAEARVKGMTTASPDGKENLARSPTVLKLHGLSLERYFQEGPLPEELKRRDFDESLLIGRLTDREVLGRVHVSEREVEARLVDLHRLSLTHLGADGKPKIEPTRKKALETLRAEHYRKGYRTYFRTLFGKNRVRCPEMPEFETVDGVSPPRPEDGEAKEMRK